MNYAVLNNNFIVENIIVAESKEIAEEITGKICIQYNDDKPASIGAIYNNGEWVKPIIEELKELENLGENMP
jgi:hypothetical protein